MPPSIGYIRNKGVQFSQPTRAAFQYLALYCISSSSARSVMPITLTICLPEVSANDNDRRRFLRGCDAADAAGATFVSCPLLNHKVGGNVGLTFIFQNSRKQLGFLMSTTQVIPCRLGTTPGPYCPKLERRSQNPEGVARYQQRGSRQQ